MKNLNPEYKLVIVKYFYKHDDTISITNKIN